MPKLTCEQTITTGTETMKMQMKKTRKRGSFEGSARLRVAALREVLECGKANVGAIYDLEDSRRAKVGHRWCEEAESAERAAEVHSEWNGQA